MAKRRTRTVPLPTDRLWRTADVAAFAGRSRTTVRTFVAMGLPTIRVHARGTGVRAMLQFDPDEVRAWFAARKSHSIIEPRARERAG